MVYTHGYWNCRGNREWSRPTQPSTFYHQDPHTKVSVLPKNTQKKFSKNVIRWISPLPSIGEQSMTSIPLFGTSSKVPQLTGRLMLNTNSSSNWGGQYYPAPHSYITSCMVFWEDLTFFSFFLFQADIAWKTGLSLFEVLCARTWVSVWPPQKQTFTLEKKKLTSRLYIFVL